VCKKVRICGLFRGFCRFRRANRADRGWHGRVRLNNPVLIDPDGGNIANHGSVLAARTLAYTDVPVPSTSHVASSEQTSKQRLGGRNNGRF
jgi:hypothetical protein